MSKHICIREKLKVYKYTFTYLIMRKSSYSRVAKRYKVPKSEVEKALKTTLPQISSWLSRLVTRQALKNSARALSELNAKK